MIINNVPIYADIFDIIGELKKQLHEQGIEMFGVMRNTPNNLMVACPYHKNGQERRPSGGFKKTDGTFHCFTCGEVHSLPEVISYCFGLDDILGSFGWNWLLKNFVTVEMEERHDIDIDFGRTVRNLGGIKYVTEEELDSYRVYHPYMWERKMTPEIVAVFDVGYDEKTNSLTFPVRDVYGNCLFVARRGVTTKFYNYPEGIEKPVYGLYELAQLERYPLQVIICESMIDAITCWAYGSYAVALNGLGNELQFKQLREMPCRQFVLGTDNDKAGLKARLRIRNKIPNKLITEFVFPENRKDINELSKEEFDALKEIF